MVARIIIAIVVLALVGAGTVLVLSVAPNEVRPNVTATGETDTTNNSDALNPSFICPPPTYIYLPLIRR